MRGINESFLRYRDYFYLKTALLLSLAGLVAYGLHEPPVVPNGGTWLGYTLGGLSSILVVWLLWFGIRKRRYSGGTSKLNAVLSAHVYLGLAALLLATLHCGMQFGWNIHTLAYVLLAVTVVSGVYGVYAYDRFPRVLSSNRMGQTVEEMLADIADLDLQCRELGLTLSQELSELLMLANRNTRIGGSLWRTLSGHDPRCPTTTARNRIEMQVASTDAEGNVLRRLLALLVRKEELVARARGYAQVKAFLQVWLFVHVPAALGLVGALIAHIFAVFYYR